MGGGGAVSRLVVFQAPERHHVGGLFWRPEKSKIRERVVRRLFPIAVGIVRKEKATNPPHAPSGPRAALAMLAGR